MTGTKRLDRLLSSVFADGDGLDVVVIDGGSTDRTLAVASEYPTRIFSCPGGRTDAYMFGIRESRGQYVMLLDTDEVVTAGLLKECRNIIMEKQPDGIAVDQYILPDKPRTLNAAQMHNLEYDAGILDSSKTNVIVLKKSLVESVKLPSSMTLGEDYALVRAALQPGSRIVKVRGKTLQYHGGSFPDMIRRTIFYGRNFSWDSERFGSRAEFISSISILDGRRFWQLTKRLSQKPNLIVPFSLYIVAKYLSFIVGNLVGKILPPSSPSGVRQILVDVPISPN
jgi:glycosyltransferase involved in cell wall biosynthesis